MTEKKLPLRKCVACRQMLPKSELVRVVRGENGFSVDVTQKAQGRGAYLCKSPECLKRCIKMRLFNKSFKAAVDGSVYSEVEQAVSEVQGDE